MQLYAIFRRNAWAPDEIEAADARSTAELEARSDEVRKFRSYVLQEPGGRLGAICLYEATSPEAIREHGEAARVPVDEIVPIVLTDVRRPDPERQATT
jgi:hypothetical protein